MPNLQAIMTRNYSIQVVNTSTESEGFEFASINHLQSIEHYRVGTWIQVLAGSFDRQVYTEIDNKSSKICCLTIFYWFSSRCFSVTIFNKA